MAGRSAGAQAPMWAIPVAIVILVAIVGFIAWKTFGKNDVSGDGPPVQTHPGMYDFKKAASDGSLGRHTGTNLPSTNP